MRRLLIAAGLVAASTAVAAQQGAMSGDALRAAVTGATIEIDTPLGTKVPIRYEDDGTMTGEAGAVAYFLGASVDRGRWWVKDDQLCQQWTKWLDGKAECMRLQREGRQINWSRDDGKTGTATLITRQVVVARRVGAPAGVGLEQPAARLSEPTAPPLRIASAEADAPIPSPRPSKVPQPRASNSDAAALAPPAKPAKQVVALATAPPVAAKRAAKAVAAAPGLPPLGTQSSAQPAPAPISIAFRVAGVAPSDVLNVRNGPSQEHLAIGALPPDARDVRVVGQCMQDWCPVQHAGIGGWVNSWYLAEDGPASARLTSGIVTAPPRR